MIRLYIRFLFLVILISLNGCKTCDKPEGIDAGVDVVEAEVPIDKIVIGDTWKLTLPDSWTERDNIQTFNVEIVAADFEKESLLILYINSYKDSFDQFGIEFLRKLRGEGFIIKSMSYMTHKCSRFIVVTAVKDSLKRFIWITLDEGNNTSYELYCGGKINTEKYTDDCHDIAKSFEITNLIRCYSE